MTDIPRFWGIYDHSRKRWLVKSNGEPFHYPSPAVAQALLDNHLADNAHVVDGRGRSLTEQLVVKEMVHDGPSVISTSALLSLIDKFCEQSSTTIEEARGADAIAEMIKGLSGSLITAQDVVRTRMGQIYLECRPRPPNHPNPFRFEL